MNLMLILRARLDTSALLHLMLLSYVQLDHTLQKMPLHVFSVPLDHTVHHQPFLLLCAQLVNIMTSWDKLPAFNAPKVTFVIPLGPSRCFVI